MEGNSGGWLKPSGDGFLLVFRKPGGEQQDSLELPGFSEQQASRSLLFLLLWRALRAGDAQEVERVTKEARDTAQVRSGPVQGAC